MRRHNRLRLRAFDIFSLKATAVPTQQNCNFRPENGLVTRENEITPRKSCSTGVPGAQNLRRVRVGGNFRTQRKRHRGKDVELLEGVQETVEAAQQDVVVVGGIVVSAFGPPEIQLDQNADVLSATAMGADGIKPVAIIEQNLPGTRGGVIADAAADAGIPVAGLFEAGQIIHVGTAGDGGQSPAFLWTKRKEIIAVEQYEAAGAEFLVVIAGEREGKLGGQRQKAAEAIGAETVGFGAGAAGDADHEIMFGLGQRVGEQGAPP